MLRVLFILGVVYGAQGAVVIDRIAVIVGKQVIKASDIDRDVRVTEFLNRAPLVINADEKKKAAERLIDQAIIRNEIATGEYHRATDAEAAAMLDQIRKDRFGGSDARLRQALSQYGLTEEDLRSQLLWQLTVLRFIDARFRPGVLVTDEEVRAYYDQHKAELRRQFARDSGGDSFEALQPKIRELLTAQKVNEEFESWLDEARRREHIEYRPGALE